MAESAIIFEVHEAEEGGYWARALGKSVFTQGENWEDLKVMVREVVNCHYDGEDEQPKVIHLR